MDLNALLSSLFKSFCLPLCREKVVSLFDKEADTAGARILEELVASGDQSHLTEGWVVGEDEDGKRRLRAQLAALENSMPGGVCDYVRRAQRLLEASRVGENPFDGFVPSVPSGVTLAFGSDEFDRFERLGAAAARRTGFVIVAGGLGERLGYSGIKLALPSETMTGTCYLELYVRHILALQALTLAATDGTSAPADAPLPTPSLIPVIIMTSDDTDAPTRALLDARDRFGLAPSQLHLIKQGKVPCLSNGLAHLATEPNDRFCLLTKPHGHGDVHALLHTSGLARKLLGQGCTHLVFLQDTNALVFGGVPAALGVSVAHSLAMNTLSVPRRAGDASGALMTLTTARPTPSTARSTSDAVEEGAVVSAASRTLVVNVEYNQLDALVRASLDARGDYNDPATGYSPFPGNTNQLIFSLAPYVEALEASGGAMPEFVNPKYTDGTRTKFKSPTRLECMMQDFPYVLPPSAAVSFTSLDDGFYAPVKNARDDAVKKAAAGQASGGAAAGEHAIYAFNRRLLALAGSRLPPAAKAIVGGVTVDAGPRVVLGAFFRPTLGIGVARLGGGAAISLSARSSLCLDGEIAISQLELDGALTIRAVLGARVTVRQLRVVNDGQALRELTSDELGSVEISETISEIARLRGYEFVPPGESAGRFFNFEAPGDYIIDDKWAHMP